MGKDLVQPPSPADRLRQELPRPTPPSPKESAKTKDGEDFAEVLRKVLEEGK